MLINDFMSIDEQHEIEEGKSSEEGFDLMKAKYNLKTLLKTLTIKRETFITNKEGEIEDDYELLNQLGKGTYGQVYKGVHKVTKQIRAVKQIPRSKIKNYQRFINEITALKTLVSRFFYNSRQDHPNVIKLFEIYECPNEVYLVQELCTGGELFDRIIKNEYLNEAQASKIFS